MFCSAVLGVALYRLSADTDFLVLSFWDFFFVLLCHDVMPVLRCMGCMECVEDLMSSFLHFQGSAFQF